MSEKIKASDFVAKAKNYLGYAYVYGLKGVKATKENINALAKQYPSVYNNIYLAKTLKNVGKMATDCSGLIYLATDKKYLLGSSQLYERAKKKGEIVSVKDAPIGAVLWKNGHVGIKISDTKQIESRGVAYGVVITDISSQKWEYGLKMDFIDYSESEAKKPTQAITNKSSKEEIKWLQSKLNEQIEQKHLKNITNSLVIDGIWGAKTANALLAYFKYKGWDTSKATGYYAGLNTIKSLG